MCTNIRVYSERGCNFVFDISNDTQEEYHVTHQCFLTNRGLYLLVWNVRDGHPGIESLNIWLQNLQVSMCIPKLYKIFAWCE